MFGKIHEIYAPNVQWHGPLMRELFGIAAVLQQTMRLVAMIPDGAFIPQHICSNTCEEGGEKVAVRWIMDGHHLGYGSLGAPTGHRLFVGASESLSHSRSYVCLTRARLHSDYSASAPPVALNLASRGFACPSSP
jgi:hypothetical protein